MAERLILCPVCRTAWPDSKYYAHSREHQRGAGVVNLLLVVSATALSIGWWVGFIYLVALVLGCGEAPRREQVERKCVRSVTITTTGLRPGYGYDLFAGKFRFGVMTMGPIHTTTCKVWRYRP